MPSVGTSLGGSARRVRCGMSLSLQAVAASPYRSGATRGWWSAHVRSPATSSARLGLVNAFGESADRYPHAELADIDRDDIDLVLLPDEPYVFTASDGPEAFTEVPTVLVSGRALTWYGPSMLTARAELLAAIG